MTAPMTQNPPCPKCGGKTWDETKSKFFKPGKPIFKCQNKQCDGAIWPPKNGSAPPQQAAIGVQPLSTPPMQISSPSPTPASTPRLTHPDVTAPETAGLGYLAWIHKECFDHALKLAVDAEKMGIGSDLTAVSALTAQLFIAATKS